MIEQTETPQLPCTQCGAMDNAWRILMGDYRFPTYADVKGRCEHCRALFYEEHREKLQELYHAWLERTFPTPSFVYGLLDPRYRCICYIGRTSNVAKRVWDHRRSAVDESSIKAAWINHLHEQGLTFEYCILSTCEPGYYVVEGESRWICEGIKRGWPLLNHQANKPGFLRKIREHPDYWACAWEDLPIGERVTMARIQAYAQWSLEMPPALPHWFVSEGARGRLSPGTFDW